MNENARAICSKDKAQFVYGQVLDKIQALDLAPVPEVYELWYVHFSGENPELSHAIDMIEMENETCDLQTCFGLYNKYIQKEEEAQQVREAGTQIQTTIKDVNDLVADVNNTTSEYNQTLSDVSAKLSSGSLSDVEAQSLLEDVAKDTAGVLDKNKLLERKLAEQAEAMEALQSDFDRVKKEALTDGLTDIANRKAFDQEIMDLIDATSATDDQTFSLVLLDIDHFKAFNDNYGHQVGDQVLRLVAKTLLDGIKGRDFVARYGGEEFAVLLPGTNQHAAQRLADNLREAVAFKEVVNRNSGEKMGRITLSGGLTEFYAGDNRDDMVERADGALYKAKAKGRDQICVAKVEVVR